MNIACFMMQKNEHLLLEQWCRYHKDLFGPENLFIFDNGSTDPRTINLLAQAERYGLNIERRFNEKRHFEEKGRVLGDCARQRAAEYEFFMFLDCDEFIAVRQAEGCVSCSRAAILTYLERFRKADEVLKIKGSYCNIPSSSTAFFFWPEQKVYFSSNAFKDVDMGFHRGYSHFSHDTVVTDIVHIHFQNKPYKELISSAREKLSARLPNLYPETLRNYKGHGMHMARYFLMSEAEYIASYDDVPRTEIPAFLDKMRSLGISMPYATPAGPVGGSGTRALWTDLAYRLVRPVLSSFSDGTLRSRLPVFSAPGKEEYARQIAPFEAVARSFCGIASWLELEEGVSEPERELKNELCDLLIAGFERLPGEPRKTRLLVFDSWKQSLVEAAYLCQGLLAARGAVFDRLTLEARDHLRKGLLSTRELQPFENNWLLFPAIIEVALQTLFGVGNLGPVTKAVDNFARWYAGDGLYKDGKDFALDYYNSFVIHPMILDVLIYAVTAFADARLAIKMCQHEERMLRYMEILERVISPQGQMPPIGRSQCYRTGKLYALGKGCLYGLIPETLSAGGLRAAINAVVQAELTPEVNFDLNGWLQPGLHGRQPELCEDYITTGSLYMATLAFLPLGLPTRNSFWADKDQPWSSAALALPDGAKVVKKDIALERLKGEAPIK